MKAAVRRLEETRVGAPAGRVARRVLGRERTPSFRYVFVVTYGRSGSTLVQGLLNTLPRVLMRGENGFYLLPLFHAMASVDGFRHTHLRHHPRAQNSAFYGLHVIKPRSFVTMTRTIVTGHLLGRVDPQSVDVLGFKEVLWYRVQPAETGPFFDFLDRAFPGCLYVLNEREHARVVGSGFWQAKDEGTVLEAIERVEDIQGFLRRTRPERTLDVRYELLTSDDPAVSEAQLKSLAEFVHGSCDDHLLETMRGTLEIGHGPYPFGTSRNRRERRQRHSANH